MSTESSRRSVCYWDVEPSDRVRASVEERLRVTVVADARPAFGGISTFAEWLSSDKVLGKRFDMQLLNTTRAAEWKGGAISIRNIVRALVDSWRTFKAARTSDIVHLQTALMPTGPLLRAVAICRMARLAGAGVICHVHTGLVNDGPYEEFNPTRLQRSLLRKLGAHKVIAVSQAGRRGLAPILPPATLDVIDNAIDPEDAPFRQDEVEDPLTILYVGAIGEAKGLLDLLNSLDGLETELPWRLEIIGGANQQGRDEAERIRGSFEAAGRGGSLVGRLDPPQLRSRIERASIFVLPSHFEGQPLALLEAMAAGLPVVATGVGGIPDIVRD